MGEVRLDGGESGQMAFQARADCQNHAIGWLQRGYSSLGGGTLVQFHEFGCHLGNVGRYEQQMV